MPAREERDRRPEPEPEPEPEREPEPALEPEPAPAPEPEPADEESSRSSFLAGLGIDEASGDEASKSDGDQPDAKKEKKSNEGLFHGGWFKKLRRRK